MSVKKEPLPPVVVNVVVALPIEDAFDLFTRGFDAWWPKSDHSVGQERTRSVHFEARAGGRIYEVLDDGSRHQWGEVLECEAPRRVAFTWHPGRSEEKTQTIEILFAADGDVTHVELVHRDWEVYDQDAEAMRGEYVMGWGHVLGECFVQAAEARK